MSSEMAERQAHLQEHKEARKRIQCKVKRV